MSEQVLLADHVAAVESCAAFGGVAAATVH